MNLVRHLLDYGPIEPIDYEHAAREYTLFRQAHGYVGFAPLLTPPSGNVKLAKTKRPVYGLSLAPSIESGYNVCPDSTPQCRAGCVAFAGKGDLPKIRQARIDKTEFLATNPHEFVTLLTNEISVAMRKHADDWPIGVRLNTFSDLPWERISPILFTFSPRAVQFYDYTKDWTRAGLDNYTLTYSASERTDSTTIRKRVARMRNVAVVFNVPRTAHLPRSYAECLVIDGDKSDYRPDDAKGVIVGLRAKGRMRRPEFEGFVRFTHNREAVAA